MADAVAVEVEAPGGEPLRVEWAPDAFGPGAGAESTWRLAGELDRDRVAALRVLSAELGDGRAVALAALRPAGAAGHGEEIVAALLLTGDDAQPIAEPLLSTEYGPDGLPRRVGLELYPSADSVPLRVAADVAAVERERDGALERVRAALAVRFGGSQGSGRYEIVTPV